MNIENNNLNTQENNNKHNTCLSIKNYIEFIVFQIDRILSWNVRNKSAAEINININDISEVKKEWKKFRQVFEDNWVKDFYDYLFLELWEFQKILGEDGIQFFTSIFSKITLESKMGFSRIIWFEEYKKEGYLEGKVKEYLKKSQITHRDVTVEELKKVFKNDNRAKFYFLKNNINIEPIDSEKYNLDEIININTYVSNGTKADYDKVLESLWIEKLSDEKLKAYVKDFLENKIKTLEDFDKMNLETFYSFFDDELFSLYFSRKWITNQKNAWKEELREFLENDLWLWYINNPEEEAISFLSDNQITNYEELLKYLDLLKLKEFLWNNPACQKILKQISEAKRYSELEKKDIDNFAKEIWFEVPDYSDMEKNKEIIKWILERKWIVDDYAFSKYPIIRFKEIFKSEDITEDEYKSAYEYILNVTWKEIYYMIQDAYEVLRDKLKLTEIPEKDQIARFIKLLFEKLKINPEDVTYSDILENKELLWENICTLFVMEKAYGSIDKKDFTENNFIKLKKYLWFEVRPEDFKEKIQKTSNPTSIIGLIQNWIEEINITKDLLEKWEEFKPIFLKEGLNSYYDFYFLNLDDFRNTFKDKENMQGFLKEVTWETYSRATIKSMLIFARAIWYEELSEEGLKENIINYLNNKWIVYKDSISERDKLREIFWWDSKIKYYFMKKIWNYVSKGKITEFFEIMDILWFKEKEYTQEELKAYLKNFLENKLIKNLEDLEKINIREEFWNFFDEDEAFSLYFSKKWLNKSDISKDDINLFWIDIWLNNISNPEEEAKNYLSKNKIDNYDKLCKYWNMKKIRDFLWWNTACQHILRWMKIEKMADFRDKHIADFARKIWFTIPEEKDYSNMEENKEIFKWVLEDAEIVDDYAFSIFSVNRFKKLFKKSDNHFENEKMTEDKYKSSYEYIFNAIWKKIHHINQDDYKKLRDSLKLNKVLEEVSEETQKSRLIELLEKKGIDLKDIPCHILKKDHKDLWKIPCFCYCLEKAWCDINISKFEKNDFFNLCDYIWIKRPDKTIMVEE